MTSHLLEGMLQLWPTDQHGIFTTWIQSSRIKGKVCVLTCVTCISYHILYLFFILFRLSGFIQTYIWNWGLCSMAWGDSEGSWFTNTSKTWLIRLCRCCHKKAIVLPLAPLAGWKGDVVMRNLTANIYCSAQLLSPGTEKSPHRGWDQWYTSKNVNHSLHVV